MMSSPQLFVENNKASYKYDSMGTYKNEILDDEDNRCEDFYGETDSGESDSITNEHALLLPGGGSSELEEEDPDQIREKLQRSIDYRQQNRFIILALVALTPTGVKFFKAAQSSFEEYLMNDPRILMSATTYSLSLSLMSLPVATLIGGAMLDYKGNGKKGKTKQEQQGRSRIQKYMTNLKSSEQSCLGSSRTPSYSAIFFLGISLLGIIVYGYGLEMLNSIPVGLAGATIFGLGEGCVVVASRTFVAHAFYGSDGAFAQGVLVAMNNLAMMASKISLPWLIENQNKMSSITSNCFHNISLDCLEYDDFTFDHNTTITEYATDTEHNDNNIWIGVVVCCMVQLLSLSAGILYALWFGLAPLPQSLQSQESGRLSRKSSTKKKEFLFSESSLHSRVTACFEKLPTTFWIVAIGRAIFVVVFKVFTRNSNSFLMVSSMCTAYTCCRNKSNGSRIKFSRILKNSSYHFFFLEIGEIWRKPRCRRHQIQLSRIICVR